MRLNRYLTGPLLLARRHLYPHEFFPFFYKLRISKITLDLPFLLIPVLILLCVSTKHGHNMFLDFNNKTSIKITFAYVDLHVKNCVEPEQFRNRAVLKE
jgi:hypothetical protein